MMPQVCPNCDGPLDATDLRAAENFGNAPQCLDCAVRTGPENRAGASDDFHKMLADMPAAIARRRATLDASPHACPACGEKRLQPGMCEDCRVKDKDKKSRLYAATSGTTARLPDQYQSIRFGDPLLERCVADKRAIAAATAAIERGASWVVLRGPAGIGKTTLAVAILRRFAHLVDEPGFFCDGVELSVARSQARLGQEPAVVHNALTARAVVVDDIGMESWTHQSAVTDVIAQRYKSFKLRTIVTTGLDDEAIAKRYGAGIARRLLEPRDNAFIVQMTESTQNITGRL